MSANDEAENVNLSLSLLTVEGKDAPRTSKATEAVGLSLFNLLLEYDEADEAERARFALHEPLL